MAPLYKTFRAKKSQTDALTRARLPGSWESTGSAHPNAPLPGTPSNRRVYSPNDTHPTVADRTCHGDKFTLTEYPFMDVPKILDGNWVHQIVSLIRVVLIKRILHCRIL